jgi:poly(3-hydroxyoctanoate) depolymerase
MTVGERGGAATVEVEGMRLQVSTEGGGPPLLLIMGIGGNLEMWRPFRELLGGVTTIAYDAPGTGGSPVRRCPQRMPSLARLAVGLLDQMGLDRVDVLGYSFGGAVAQELARGWPRRVRRLILGATHAGLGSVPGNPLALSLLATPLRYYSEAHLRWMLPIAMGGASGRDPAAAARQAHLRFASRPSVLGYAWQLAAVTGWSSLPWLHRIPQPTLIVLGEKDPLIPTVNARLMRSRLPDARTHIVRGGGHLFLMDQPEEVVDVVEDFLRGPEDG